MRRGLIMTTAHRERSKTHTALLTQRIAMAFLISGMAVTPTMVSPRLQATVSSIIAIREFITSASP